MSIGDEALVVHAFCAWLRDHGWTTSTEVGYIDVVAERDGQRLYAEAKGATAAPDTDVDTAYGQLLRRMPTGDEPGLRYALVIRDDPSSVRAATRVPQRVLDVLGITIYAVARDCTVRQLPGRTEVRPT